MKCIWQMDGDKVKGFKCDFSPVDMLIVVSGLKYITADMERHPKDRERAQMIYNKIMLARYTDEQDKAEEFVKGIKALHIIEVDRKTENCSEKPNNSTSSKMEQVEEPTTEDWQDWKDRMWTEAVATEPTTQTETQNSNLTFKTLEYCDICDHKGCEECIANALDEHCIPSQFKKQIEDECAKEYEELGLKELKELIKADRKTENCSEIPNNCETCANGEGDIEACGYCRHGDLYEPKTEPTISKMEQVDKDINVRSKGETQGYCNECKWYGERKEK